METYVFDIETGPLPMAELTAMLPPFDPSEVKVGNLKDPEKVAEKIAQAREEHRSNFFNKAALDPLTGRVLAIGVLDTLTEEAEVLAVPEEARMLEWFWKRCKGEMGRIETMIGFNSNLFDLPFLIRRSWRLGVLIPFGIRRGRYWGDSMVDLREVWQLGDRMARGSLDAISRHLEVGQKSGVGADFAGLLASDREAALAYLRKDLGLTLAVARKLGVVA